MPILDKNNKELVEKYNKFIESSRFGRLTQSLSWTKVKNNWESEVVYLEENGEITASMLILIQKIPIKPYTFMYSPRGPVCNTYDIYKVKELIEEARVLAKKYKAYVLKFDPAIKYEKELQLMYEKEGFITSGENPDHDAVIQPSYDAILDIDGKDEEQLLKGFAEKTRYNIRLSKRKGVEVYFSRNKEDLKTFYELYKITCQRDKIGCRGYDYFERMLDSFDEKHLRIYIAKHENDKLSAAIAIKHGIEMFYLYGASSNEKRNLMPNYLMQWEMIKWGLEEGCKQYNFGGIIHLNKDNGLYKFKTGFCLEKGVFKYVGEINYVYNKPVYFLYTKGLPVIKKIKRFFRKFRKIK